MNDLVPQKTSYRADYDTRSWLIGLLSATIFKCVIWGYMAFQLHIIRNQTDENDKVVSAALQAIYKNQREFSEKLNIGNFKPQIYYGDKPTPFSVRPVLESR